MHYVIRGERIVKRPRAALYDELRAVLERDAERTGRPASFTPPDRIDAVWVAPEAADEAPSGPFGTAGELQLIFSEESERATRLELRMTTVVAPRWWLVLKVFGKGAGLDGGLMLDDLLKGIPTERRRRAIRR